MSEAVPSHGGQPTLADADMPPLFTHADTRAIRRQNLYFAWLRTELILLVTGVLVGAFSGSISQIGPVSLILPPFTIFSVRISTLNVFEVAEATLLLAAVTMRVLRVVWRPDRVWYEARAVAESVKSLAWRYAVGGEPFQHDLQPEALQRVLADRFDNMQKDLSRYTAPEAVRNAPYVTAKMNEIRGLPLETRKQVYRDGRVDDQQQWYTRKATFNRRYAVRYHIILIVVEILAVGAALLPFILAALHIFPLNLQAVATNIATGGAAWMQAKRYEDLEVSYKVTSKELNKVSSDIDQQQSEMAWSHFIENVEGSMSREHQLWRATRTNAD